MPRPTSPEGSGGAVRGKWKRRGEETLEGVVFVVSFFVC